MPRGDGDPPKVSPASEERRTAGDERVAKRSKRPKRTQEKVVLLTATLLWMLVLGVMSCAGNIPVRENFSWATTPQCWGSAAVMSEPFVHAALLSLLSSFTIDMLFCALSPVLAAHPDPEGPSQTARWFCMHFVINAYITVLTWPDVVYCFNNIGDCALRPWEGGTWGYGIAVGLHFYHLVFFNVTAADWLHHLMTAVFTTPTILLFHQQSHVAVALFFMSGLPGGIDYFLLTLVKLRRFNPLMEKQIYVVISVWLRGPGVLSAVFFGLRVVLGNQLGLPWYKHLGMCWNGFVTYWNAMYFMHCTLSDYYRPGRGKVAS